MAEAELTKLIDETAAAFRTLLEDACQRAYRLGGDDRAASIMAAAQGLFSAPATFTAYTTPVPSVTISANPVEAPDSGEYKAKAPRGLLEKVLKEVFAERQGQALSTPEVEQAALAKDDRIALKSVYNQLRAAEKAGGPYMRNSKGLWVLVKPSAPEVQAPSSGWGVSSSPPTVAAWFGRSGEGEAG